MSTPASTFAACLCIMAASLTAQDEERACPEIHALAVIMRSRSVHSLRQARQNTPLGYRTELVTAFRVFQLQPGNATAADQLLRLIPKDDTQQEQVMTLDSSLCDDETLAEMTVLARVPDEFPTQLAKAVRLSPQHIAPYVKYSIIAVGDPHSDYAPQMARLCRKAHGLFMRGLNQLSQGDKEFISEQVMEPATCHALALPEAD